MTGGKTLPAELLERIVAQTDGVPLFIEELTRAMWRAVWWPIGGTVTRLRGRWNCHPRPCTTP